MINTKNAVELRREILPKHYDAGGGYVSILRQPDGKVIIKRFISRGSVVNFVDRYEHVVDGKIEVVPLTEESAWGVVDRALAGTPWSACFVIADKTTELDTSEWIKTEEEHKYTSTGRKFWRHREAMESFRDGTGRSVISTHISPEGACNLRCPYCSVTYRDTDSRIALPRVKKYVSDLQSRGLKAVILTGGGEPTLYPQFDELVQWIKGRGLSVALITNGTTARHVHPDTWRCFSWVRVSINVFDGWQNKIELPIRDLAKDCVVGCSFIYTIEHEASSGVPLERVELFKQVAEVATNCGAKYIRVLPNCLLPQHALKLEHQMLKETLASVGDSRFFQQYKVHGAPNSRVCEQAYFRPYLSEERFQGGEPGTVYPCDSVVLNDAAAHFAGMYQICPPEKVLDFLDGKIEMKFEPRHACEGCVFTDNVEQLAAWKIGGCDDFDKYPDPLEHEEFV